MCLRTTVLHEALGHVTATAGLHFCWLQTTERVGVSGGGEDQERAVAIPTSVRGLRRVPRDAY